MRASTARNEPTWIFPPIGSMESAGAVSLSGRTMRLSMTTGPCIRHGPAVARAFKGFGGQQGHSFCVVEFQASVPTMAGYVSGDADQQCLLLAGSQMHRIFSRSTTTLAEGVTTLGD